MTSIVTQLCLRDTACTTVCPVDCMVLGKPESKWPWLYIDPDTCTDCGACIPECPHEAIFVEEEVPDKFIAKKDQWITNTKELLPDGVSFHGEVNGMEVTILNGKQLKEGDVIDLTNDIQPNYDFFEKGPGYDVA